MKKLLLIVGLIVPFMAFSQSNQQGTIQLGLGWGLTLGGATITSTFAADTLNGIIAGDHKGSGVGAKANYGIKGQYGLSENISAGIYIRREAAVYTTTYNDINTVYGGYYSSSDITTSGLALGLEAKYYVVNKDHFNLFFGPTLGFYSGKATFDSYSIDGSLHGLNYGLGMGFDWYWGNTIGMSLDLAYNGQSLSGTPNNIDLYVPTKYKVTGGGFYFGLGVTAKFGGK